MCVDDEVLLSMCSFVITGESLGSIVQLHSKGLKERRESATTATVHTQTSRRTSSRCR